MNIDKQLLSFKVFGFEKTSEIVQSIFTKGDELKWKDLTKTILKMESKIGGFSEVNFDSNKMVLQVEFYKANGKEYEIDSIVNFDIMLYPSAFDGIEDDIVGDLN